MARRRASEGTTPELLGASVTTLAQRINYGGVDLTWCYYRTAYFVDKILRGIAPSDRWSFHPKCCC
jgi:hypothetical protein